MTRVSPLKRPSLLIVGFDETHDPCDKLLSGLENATPDDLAGQEAEPDFDLVEPAGVRGSISQLEPLLLAYPGPSFLAGMRRAVVDNDVQLLVGIGVQEPA